MAEEEQTENAEQAGTAEAPVATSAGGEGGDAPERLSPKEIRRRKRSTHKGPQGKPLTLEERLARRAAKRAANAATRRRLRAAAVKAGGTGTPPAVREPGSKKVSQGIVVSSKAEKTITVRVESAHRHPTYEKIIRRSKLLHAHDEGNEAGEGDLVRIVESRPMSKTKRWRLTEILERAK